MKYKFTGDRPVSLPSHGLDNVRTGDTVEVTEVIDHPHFELVKETKPKSADKED